MAGSSLLMLIDDIATVLDDVAILTKVAAKKTSGVLGDDLALNAQQVSGIRAERELPVVWAVAMGSLINKAILVPVALIISVLANWLIMPLLMIGGLFLCFEGSEKLWHLIQTKFSKKIKEEDEHHHKKHLEHLVLSDVELVQLEKRKIKGAIRTDFILSAEIIAITLGTVATLPISIQISVLISVSLFITIGVYGLVAAIVKLDDLGLHLLKSGATGVREIGRMILKLAPYLMKTLSIVGTIAMFLVGGGIIAHGVPAIHHWIEDIGKHTSSFYFLWSLVAEGLLGLLCGVLVLIVFNLIVRRFFKSNLT